MEHRWKHYAGMAMMCALIIGFSARRASWLCLSVRSRSSGTKPRELCSNYTFPPQTPTNTYQVTQAGASLVQHLGPFPSAQRAFRKGLLLYNAACRRELRSGAVPCVADSKRVGRKYCAVCSRAGGRGCASSGCDGARALWINWKRADS